MRMQLEYCTRSIAENTIMPIAVVPLYRSLDWSLAVSYFCHCTTLKKSIPSKAGSNSQYGVVPTLLSPAAVMLQQPSQPCANPIPQPILNFRSLFCSAEQKNNNEGYGRERNAEAKRRRRPASALILLLLPRSVSRAGVRMQQGESES